MLRSVFLVGIAVLALAGCRKHPGYSAGGVDSTELASRATRLEQLKVRADTASRDEPIARWVLPPSLNEISGLALTRDGRLLAHDDEQGSVWILDYRRGVILKEFHVGHNLHEDFEGITIANGDIYLLASNGKLFQFQEGGDREQVRYTRYDTELGKECEFEGVAYDSTRNELELACKTVGTKRLRDQLVIYRWSLAGNHNISRLTIRQGRIIGGHDWKQFKPSDITVDPVTGYYVLISSQEKALLVITPEGAIVSVRSLPAEHDQAEGVAVTSDSILIVSDEAVRKPAAITLYRWP